MKKLLIISLLSSALIANASLKTDLQDIGSQMAEVVVAPARAVKNAVVENEIDTDVVDVVCAYPKFFVEQAQEAKELAQETTSKIANSKFAADVKRVNTKVVDSAKTLGTKVKDASVKATNAVKDAKNKTVDAVKNATDKTTAAVKSVVTKVANSNEVADIKDVGAQFAAVPSQFWAAVKVAGKAIKNEIW